MKPKELSFSALIVALGLLSARAETPDTTAAPIAQPAMQVAPVAPADASLAAKLSPPAREIVKMAAAGIPDDVLKAYIDSSASTFNLTPEAIIHLQGVGISGAVTTAMLAHDKMLIDRASAFPQMNFATAPGAQPPAAPPMSSTSPYPDTTGQPDYGAAPPEPNYYYNDYSELSPYGSWCYVGGYGWCWQPYAWLGAYPYPWGLNAFGYGRWWHHPERGWFWAPNGFRGTSRGFASRGAFIGGQNRGFNTGQPFVMHSGGGFGRSTANFSTFNHGAMGSGFRSFNSGGGGGFHR